MLDNTRVPFFAATTVLPPRPLPALLVQREYLTSWLREDIESIDAGQLQSSPLLCLCCSLEEHPEQNGTARQSKNEMTEVVGSQAP
jgi:hypothetical protein